MGMSAKKWIGFIIGAFLFLGLLMYLMQIPHVAK